ncbi:hypothetical protein ACSBR2_026294 [Camellia fascicularis]
MLMLLFAMSVTLILFAFTRQRQRKRTKQYQRKQKKLFLMAKERKMHIPWPPPTTPCTNVGVVIRDEHDLNVIRVRAAKDKEKVNPMSKGKEKMAPSGKRMTNACQVVYKMNLLFYVVFGE